ncbi:ABC transporter permease [Rhizobium sp. KVB221]|uniref:ABC transporter permease n=1 Tax=Rhizobium setariae TaxID=2801340 RepID=A0A936YNY3_9HYPH|nr:ABC transporter permease [Rhizobium setariae]MBL0373978.1 ABC transporter permease [Rhizobium setariae]
MIALWLSGILRRRTARVAGLCAGIALTVAMLSTLAFFLSESGASMTERAISDVPIDWQVEAVPGADQNALIDAIKRAAPVKIIHQVKYAQSDGFEARTADTTQQTGPGKVIAFDANYAVDFPKELRWLAGKRSGVLIAQQTAANLHVGPGDNVSIKRLGLPPVEVKIDGVVDLPDADALFQGVGLPPQAAPQAPPDNVVILPISNWHEAFDAQQAKRPDTTRTQFHVRLVHDGLPSDPTKAYTVVAGQSRNLEARVAGQALVSTNLGARLDTVRSDALYATVLFLFLGIPGVALALVLTVSLANAGAGARMQEQSLLRIHGASDRKSLMLLQSEPFAIGIVSTLLGFFVSIAFSSHSGALADTSSLLFAALAAVLGGAVAMLAIAVSAFRASRATTVVGARQAVGRSHVPLWQSLCVDLVMLACAGLLFWQSASTGYEIVLAPEGVPAASVDYNAFLSPALFSMGFGLLIFRLCRYFISTSNPLFETVLRPISGTLAGAVAASIAFQQLRISRGIVMTALAVAFVTSTAIFNVTYEGQTRVDAELTNGADVTVFGTTAHPAGGKLETVKNVPGVEAARTMQHRFAYVGSDLQDLYGIDPRSIGAATTLSDAYFRGGTTSEILAKLAATPNGVLVSEETVSDFQLLEGDTINLRLVSAKDNQYHAVPFKFIGVAREFPTAPRDSFLVANADYVSKMSESTAAEYVLVRASSDPGMLSKAIATALGPTSGLDVKNIGDASHIIGTSLTAVNVGKLAVIELFFGAVMAVAAGGLMVGLGFIDRRRNYAVLTLIGAKPRQLAGFLWSEGVLVLVGGIVFGVISGVTTAWMLVKLLTGVFDPPPETISVPWGYLASVYVMIAGSVLVAIAFASRRARVGAYETLRDL